MSSQLLSQSSSSSSSSSFSETWTGLHSFFSSSCLQRKKKHFHVVTVTSQPTQIFSFSLFFFWDDGIQYFSQLFLCEIFFPAKKLKFRESSWARNWIVGHLVLGATRSVWAVDGSGLLALAEGHEDRVGAEVGGVEAVAEAAVAATRGRRWGWRRHGGGRPTLTEDVRVEVGMALGVFTENR